MGLCIHACSGRLLQNLVQLGAINAQGGGIEHAFQVGLGDLFLALRTQCLSQAFT